MQHKLLKIGRWKSDFFKEYQIHLCLGESYFIEIYEVLHFLEPFDGYSFTEALELRVSFSYKSAASAKSAFYRFLRVGVPKSLQTYIF